MNFCSYTVPIIDNADPKELSYKLVLGKLRSNQTYLKTSKRYSGSIRYLIKGSREQMVESPKEPFPHCTQLGTYSRPSSAD